MLDRVSFSNAIALATAQTVAQGGIGTYGEKMLHRTLKFYFEPNEDYHEVAYLGSVADIRNENGIVEIQTRSFDKLVPKLERFLEADRVTVVYPIIVQRTICRIDTETGESKSPRKSRKKGSAVDALGELYKIRRFIPHQNLTVSLVFLDATETRMLSGHVKVGRKRTSKIDCIPTSLNSIIDLKNPLDFYRLLPPDLPKQFTAAEFEECTKLRALACHGALMLLLQLGILSRERQGNKAYVYSIKENI